MYLFRLIMLLYFSVWLNAVVLYRTARKILINSLIIMLSEIEIQWMARKYSNFEFVCVFVCGVCVCVCV